MSLRPQLFQQASSQTPGIARVPTLCLFVNLDAILKISDSMALYQVVPKNRPFRNLPSLSP